MIIYPIINHRLNESVLYDAMYTNEDAILKLGEIEIPDISKKEMVKVSTSDLIKICSDALYKMHRDYPYLYQFLVKCKVMYLPTYPSSFCDTMMVDSESNLWINLGYVYNKCKMSKDRVFGVLFHEMFHIFFEHPLRFKNIYPDSMFAGMPQGVHKKANMKSNICMDYEVNSSMVEDGIVTADFFNKMNMLYKPEYAGMTWEDILRKYGDKEYDEWLSRNGFSLNDVEKKVLEAIEKASKVLLDPDAGDEEKRAARKQLQKDLDSILGKSGDNKNKSIQDILEDLQSSKLGDNSEISNDFDDIIDDLYKNPSGMSESELDKTMKDMQKLANDICENADQIGQDFKKSGDDVFNDAKKANDAFNDAMQKIHDGGLSKEEKEDLIDQAKDALEDIIADDTEKERLKKQRQERDEKKAAKRLEQFKKKHPITKMIIVMKNLMGLIDMGLISENTAKLLKECMILLEPLTEKNLSDLKKKDVRELSDALDELQESFLPDLVELINNDTILNKDEDDMKDLLDRVFEYVFKGFEYAFDKTHSEEDKRSMIEIATQKLRILGKILKTQKKWRVGDDFKQAYIEEMKRLTSIFKTDGDEAMFKELFDNNAISPLFLDDRGQELWDKMLSGISKSDIVDDLDYFSQEEEHDPFDGDDIYYDFSVDPDDENRYVLMLSDNDTHINDDWDVYCPLAKRFQNDFPDYIIVEEMESIFDVLDRNTGEVVPMQEVQDAIDKNPVYKKGQWMNN